MPRPDVDINAILSRRCRRLEELAEKLEAEEIYEVCDEANVATVARLRRVVTRLDAATEMIESVQDERGVVSIWNQ